MSKIDEVKRNWRKCVIDNSERAKDMLECNSVILSTDAQRIVTVAIDKTAEIVSKASEERIHVLSLDITALQARIAELEKENEELKNPDLYTVIKDGVRQRKSISDLETENTRLKEQVNNAAAMLRHVQCPQGCGGTGAIQISEDDVEQCQWCAELQQLKELGEECNVNHELTYKIDYAKEMLFIEMDLREVMSIPLKELGGGLEKTSLTDQVASFQAGCKAQEKFGTKQISRERLDEDLIYNVILDGGSARDIARAIIKELKGSEGV